MEKHKTHEFRAGISIGLGLDKKTASYLANLESYSANYAGFQFPVWKFTSPQWKGQCFSSCVMEHPYLSKHSENQ